MAILKKGERELRKNEVLFEAGTPADKFYIVKQGLISVNVATSSDKIEIYKAPQNHFVGDEVLQGKKNYATTAIALNDSILIEMSSDETDIVMETTTPSIRYVSVGMIAKQLEIFKELHSYKIDAAEKQPCPADKVAKLFAVIYSVASYIGVKKNDAITVEWNSFRKYSQRVFLESPVRIAQVMWLLVNVKIATMQMIPDETDPEAPEVLGYIHFNDLEVLKSFYEFYRKTPQQKKAEPENSMFTAILAGIDFWNKNGMPEGSPPPVVESKYAPKD